MQKYQASRKNQASASLLVWLTINKHSTQYFKAPIHKINFLDPLGSIWGFVNAEVQNHNSTQATLKDEHDEGPVDDFKDDKSKDRRQFTLQVVDDADRGDFFDITNSITANTIADFAFESLGHELRDNSLGLVPPPSKPVEENRDVRIHSPGPKESTPQRLQL